MLMPANWLSKYYNNESILLYLCLGIAFTVFWWPLANTLLILLLTLYWLFFLMKKISINKGKKIIVAFTFTYVVVLLGAYFSENRHETLFRIQQKSSLLFLPLIFGTTALLSENLIRRTIIAFSFSAALMSAYFLLSQVLNMLLGRPVTLVGYDLIAFPQMTPSAFTTMALFAFTSILYLCFYSSFQLSVSKKYFFCGAAFLILVTLILAGNRLSIIMAFAILVALLLPKIKKSFFLIPLVGLLFILLVVKNNYLSDRFKKLWVFSNESVIQLDVDSSLGKSWDGSSIRLAIWRCSFDLIKQHGLIGLGTGDVQDELQKAYEKRKFYFASRYNNYNAHNQYIQQLLAHGVIGLFSLLLSMGIGFYLALKQKNALYFYFLIIFAVICLTESFLEINKGIIWYSFFNSLFAFSKKQL
jgi:O-antigen ligase